MDDDRINKFIIAYCSLILPVILMVIAMMFSAGVLWFLLLLVWICSGIMLVFLPSNVEAPNQ
jgi:hypothetical protein